MSKVVQHPSSAIEPLVPPDIVAEFLGVETDTVRKWAGRRKIPHRKVNGVLRFLMSEVSSWALEECNRPVRMAR